MTIRIRKTQCVRCGGEPVYRTTTLCHPCQNNRRKENYKKNPEIYKEHSRKSRAKRRLAVIEAYGGSCYCCGESLSGLLSVDHVGGGGNDHRRKIVGVNKNFYDWLRENNYPKDGFQLACYNCNLGAAFNGGICPHKENNA